MTDTPTTDYKTALTKARSTALTALRRNHRTEYNQLIADAMTAAGHTYTPPPTPEEKAAQRISRIAAEAGLEVSIHADPPTPEAANP